jgi:hypothetical protein
MTRMTQGPVQVRVSLMTVLKVVCIRSGGLSSNYHLPVVSSSLWPCYVDMGWIINIEVSGSYTQYLCVSEMSDQVFVNNTRDLLLGNDIDRGYWPWPWVMTLTLTVGTALDLVAIGRHRGIQSEQVCTIY